jgi:hypothetical protein
MVGVMPFSLDLIHRLVERALEEFFHHEADGLAGDVSERNSCGRLAMHMQREASEEGLVHYFADTEYNRKQGGQVKTILDDEMKVITITADLILHSRGQSIPEDNLIAVEMKKAGRPSKEKQADRDRLRAMTKASYDGVWSNDGSTHPEHVCGYRLGVYIELNSADRTARLEYFVGGRCTGTESKSY